jgi:hypothetical protein
MLVAAVVVLAAAFVLFVLVLLRFHQSLEAWTGIAEDDLFVAVVPN